MVLGKESRVGIQRIVDSNSVDKNEHPFHAQVHGDYFPCDHLFLAPQMHYVEEDDAENVCSNDGTGHDSRKPGLGGVGIRYCEWARCGDEGGVTLHEHEELCDDFTESETPSKKDVFEVVLNAVGIKEVPSIKPLLPNGHFAVATSAGLGRDEKVWRGFGLHEHLGTNLDAIAIGRSERVSVAPLDQLDVPYTTGMLKAPVFADGKSRMAPE